MPSGAKRRVSIESPQSESPEACWVSFYFLYSGFLHRTANHLEGHKETLEMGVVSTPSLG